MSLLFKLIKAKWFFTKPSKKKILIFDRYSENFSKVFFSNNSCEILDTRYESINIYVLFTTILNTGIKNLKRNYIIIFIKLVSPRIVFTSIDNNSTFYKLKDMYSKPFYICCQNGLRDNQFYKECKKYFKKTKKKLKADHIFLFGNTEKKRISKIIEGNIHSAGNIINNHYSIKLKKIKKKIDSIMYISSGIRSGIKDTYPYEIKIFNHLVYYCKKKNIKLSFCSRSRKVSEEVLFRNTLAKGNWNYYSRLSTQKTYTNLNKQQLIVFNWSTLGFEALAKGIKCAAFFKIHPVDPDFKKYKKSGPFWTYSSKYKDFEKLLNKVIGISNKGWKKVVDKYSSEILSYNPDNIKIKKIFKEILN